MKDSEKYLKTMFNGIRALWNIYGDECALPRRVLHERIWDNRPEPEIPESAVLAHNGIDLALDTYAKSGPDYANFKAILNEQFEPDAYFRYRVNRGGEILYVLSEALTYEERIAITAELRSKGAVALAEASVLQQELERRERKLAVVK